MNIQFADRLVALRREQGWSQEELALRLGVSRQAVSKWERAESSPDTDNLIALARLYGISLDELLLHAPEEGEQAQAREDREVFAAAEAWEAGEARLEKQRKKRWAKRKESFLWLLTLTLMVALPLLSRAVGLGELYALAVNLAFLLTGFLLGNWHPGWLLYLTIPFYYTLINKKRHLWLGRKTPRPAPLPAPGGGTCRAASPAPACRPHRSAVRTCGALSQKSRIQPAARRLCPL